MIPFFDYQNLFAPYKTELLSITEKIISDGKFIFGDELEVFEKSCVKKIGCAYALGVGNATDAIEILLQAHDIPSGAEILISSHTMSATASAIVKCGGVPTPVDIDEHGMMNVQLLEQSINDRTWAIMPTQLNGTIADMEEIIRLSKKYSLKLFEDSAQAFGASYKDTYAGNFGDGGVFSFYPAKILGCLGDGGMLVLNDVGAFKKALLIRDHGRNEQGETELIGRNSRLDNLQAAYLNYFLTKHFDNWIESRKKISKTYDKILGDLSSIRIPSYNSRPYHVPVYQNYELLAQDRNELRDYLRERGIGTLVQWGGHSINHTSVFVKNLKLKFTDNYFEKCLMLPLNQTVSVEAAQHIGNQVRKFYGK